jgi:hypothetical protein
MTDLALLGRSFRAGLSAFFAAEVPDASQEEVGASFASVWGFGGNEKGLYHRVLAVCDRHNTGEDESTKDYFSARRPAST